MSNSYGGRFAIHGRQIFCITYILHFRSSLLMAAVQEKVHVLRFQGEGSLGSCYLSTEGLSIEKQGGLIYEKMKSSLQFTIALIVLALPCIE